MYVQGFLLFTIFEFFLSGDTHYEAYMHKKMVFMYNLNKLKISLPIGNRYNYYSMVKNRNNRKNRNKFQINKSYMRFISQYIFDYFA